MSIVHLQFINDEGPDRLPGTVSETNMSLRFKTSLHFKTRPNTTYELFLACLRNKLSKNERYSCCFFSTRYVSEKLGGQVHREYIYNFEWDAHIQGLKIDLKSNIVPLGMIKFGIHYHRALLFKVSIFLFP